MEYTLTFPSRPGGVAAAAGPEGATMKGLVKNGKTAALMAAMAAGVFVPQAHALAFLIPYQLSAMLFLAFLGLEFHRRTLHWSLAAVLLANVSVAFLGYSLLRGADHTLALAAFMTGISPTAITAPVIAGFLGRRVEYLVASLLLSNLSMAVVVPLALPGLVGGRLEIAFWDVMGSVVLVVFVPLGLAVLTRLAPGKARRALARLKPHSFYIWLTALFLVMAKSSHFIRDNLAVSKVMLLEIAVVSLAICAVNFSLGAAIGGKEYRHEASHALGQKNLSLTIWLALTFVDPVVALGPTFYVVYHNVYNSIQLYAYQEKKARARR